MIVIFVEFINQLISYSINRASLTHNMFLWRNKKKKKYQFFLFFGCNKQH